MRVALGPAYHHPQTQRQRLLRPEARLAIATEHDQFVQILTAEGKHFGDFDFSFSPPFENITFVDCEVLLDYEKLASGIPWPTQLHMWMARCNAVMSL